MPNPRMPRKAPLPESSEPPTLAIFSVSAGGGHIRAADALAATATLQYPRLKVIHVDVMDLVPRLFKSVYADSYSTLVERHPGLWGYLYKRADRRRVDSALDRFRTEIERLNTKRLKDFLLEFRPDAVICTHFLPAELLARWRRRRRFFMPVWVVVTDFDVHMLWIQKNLSGYCVASEEVAWRLKDRGVTGSEIRVTGIPIAPAFSVRRSKEECARELGLDPERQTVLLMAGAAGVIPLHKLARRLLDLGHDVQLIAVAGKSRRLLGALQEVASGAPDRMRAIGYSSTIERLMRASDLAITKPGGLTTAECLAMGVPMLIVSPIPGQEERNADFLLEQGAAFKAYDAAGVEYRVRSLLGEPARLRAMKENAGRIGKPEAATDILRIALRDLTATAVRSSTGCL